MANNSAGKSLTPTRGGFGTPAPGGHPPTMRFAVLGPVGVVEGDAEIPLSSPVHRVLVAMLLLHANKVVSANVLAAAIWDGAPPATARTSLQNHVMRLRRTLGAAAGGRLITRTPGYLMEVRDGELDLNKFTRLRDSGRMAARRGAWHDAARLLQAALGQWTGELFANVRTSDPLAGEAQRLTELRLQTVELRIEAELRCGHHSDVIGELYSLVSLHPLREHFRELLMMALYRDGRPAEALAVYQDIRRTLVDELGIEPTSQIQRLHEQILADDPALARVWPAQGNAAAEGYPPVSYQAVSYPPGCRPAAAHAVPLPDHAVPRPLPPAFGPFVSRDKELRQLARWLRHARRAGQPRR
jgi:DNA-binding SARP family transcriptional activator